MSITAVGNVLNFSPSELKSSEVLVLLVLADYTNDDGFCWPSFKTISDKAHLSRRQVIRILTNLEKTGEIEMTQRAGERGNTSNKYFLKRTYWDVTTLVTNCHHPSVTHDTTLVSPMSPDPLDEPSIEVLAISDVAKEYSNILDLWKALFPKKPQPRFNGKANKTKFVTRMRTRHFQDNWKEALQTASKSNFLHSGSWFQLGWFLKNDENYEKCLNGNYTDSTPSGQSTAIHEKDYGNQTRF